jgi:SpoVK/Ycf46/Vps4 family AAA+-type ATPase
MGADGRVMADAANFAQIDADTYHEMMNAFHIEDDGTIDNAQTIVGEADLWRCYNRIPGFSMRLKRWGWLDVDGLSPVVWRDDAFEQLVLEEKQKRSILHLVKHYGSSFSDFIDGKSGGLIFLLFGPPGSGKTLSAEAVAESLHRPLYTVSVGELGITPEAMEEKLRSILDLAYQWNAVLLLDEADIFMEARDTINVERNAMVSIFLRQLEYYSGVMFLTTNRVATFDPAFFSRISLAISYPKLDGHDRESVWRNVLHSAGISVETLDLTQLAKYEVNGRNIKTAVRIAQTMAAGDHRAVIQDDFMEVLEMTATFNRQLNRLR